jgi:hypothetical protein
VPNRSLYAKRRKGGDSGSRGRSGIESQMFPTCRTDGCALQNDRPAMWAGACPTRRRPANCRHEA